MIYKFKKGDIVYINSPLETGRHQYKINQRKIENGFALYTLGEKYFDREVPCYFFNFCQKLKYLFSKRRGFRQNKLIYKFFKEEYNVGLKNYPRMDNWIQEERLLKTKPEDPEKECSFNGCEIVNKFLNGN